MEILPEPTWLLKILSSLPFSWIALTLTTGLTPTTGHSQTSLAKAHPANSWVQITKSPANDFEVISFFMKWNPIIYLYKNKDEKKLKNMKNKT